jgi:hypothetical protein
MSWFPPGRTDGSPFFDIDCIGGRLSSVSVNSAGQLAVQAYLYV